jgi:cell filamentation protein
LSQDEFAVKGARFITSVNAIPPFREGHGRTQLAFFTLLAEIAGYSFDLDDENRRDALLQATIASFDGEEPNWLGALASRSERHDPNLTPQSA